MDTLPKIRLQSCNSYDMGFWIGARFEMMIRNRIAKDPYLSSALLPFATSEPGERLIQNLSARNRECYPEYWDELRGVAEGSGVPFLEVLLLNFRKEVASFLPQKDVSKSAAEADQCSDVLLCSDHLAVIAHNEDADVSLRDHVYIVHATLKTGTSFFAYTYAGELPSCAFGFNSHGVAFTVNSVPPTPEEIVPGGIGRNFVCRDLLEATNIDDALNRIKGAKLSVGHNYNVMDINLQRIVTIEAASRERYFVHEIKGNPFFHANMYLHLLEVRQIPHDSSIHRQKRAAELPQSTAEEMLTLLGDTNDQAFPVYMHGPQLYTLHTVVFNLRNKSMMIFKGNPKLHSVLMQVSMQL
ncbi:unnamed protein product [Calypogeia fissa]